MNKNILLNIIKKCLIQLIDHNLNATSYLNIYNNRVIEELNPNKLVYEETLFFTDIFSIIPYYDIKNLFRIFQNNLEIIDDDLNHKDYTIPILIAYLMDLTEHLDERINTIIDNKLYYIFSNYLFYNYIDLNKITDILLKNDCDINKLFGLSVAENYLYDQISFVNQNINLDEEVSKSNFNYKTKCLNNLIELLTKNINEIVKFRELINNAIDDDRLYIVINRLDEVINKVQKKKSRIKKDNNYNNLIL